jgi:hypothetical protein
MMHKPLSTNTKTMELTKEYLDKTLDQKFANFEHGFTRFETGINQRLLDIELAFTDKLEKKFLSFQILFTAQLTSKIDQRLLDFEIRLERKFDEKLEKRLAEQGLELTKQLTEAYKKFNIEGVEAQQVWVTENFVSKASLKAA